MANTYTQINVHAVFAVQGRENILNKNVRDELFRYLKGILNNHRCFSLAINGFTDHVHVFFELNPSIALSDIMRLIKTNSSKWINENKKVPGKFSWQNGYGAFSYARSQRDTVIHYIMNQEEHHKKKTFREEYLEALKKFDIQFDDVYNFEFYT